MEFDIPIDTPELVKDLEDIGTTLTVENVLGPGGLLAQHVTGYEDRHQQLRMAELVVRCNVIDIIGQERWSTVKQREDGDKEQLRDIALKLQ